MLRSWRRVALASFLAWVAAAAGVARAQPTAVPRLIVLNFAGGARADEAREAVLVAIASYVELIEEQRAIAFAQEQGIDLTSPEGMSELAVAMGVTLVITGEVRSDGTTALSVVNPEGEPLAQVEVPGAGRRRPDLEALGAAAVQAVQDAQAELDRQRAEAEAAAEAEAEANAAEPEPEPVAPVEPEPEPAPTQGWRQPLMILAGGVRLRNASTVAHLTDGSTAFLASDPYAEIDLYALFHPLTDATDLSRGLIFGVQGSFSVANGYLGASMATHDMQSYHVRADVGYGYTAGDIFEIAGLAGFGIDGMSLDQADGFPSALFSYVRIGALGRVRAYEDLLVVELGVGGRIGIDAGDLTSAFGDGLDFGGVDLFAGLSGTIEGFHWMARFGFSHMALGFAEGPGPFADATNGADETLEGRLLVGYAL